MAELEKPQRLALILRSYAADLGLAGPQYASMAAVLREAANELDPPPARTPAPADPLVIDSDDGLPGFRGTCTNCWEGE